MLEYDRIRLKQAARQAMKAQRPHPMLVTFVFAAIGGIGGQILTQILGMVTGSTSLNTQYFQAVWEYGDTDTALQYILMAYGPQRLIFALLVGGGLSTLLVALWQGLLRVGYSGFCLDMARRRQPQLETLFRAFPQAGSVLLTQLLVFVFRFLWILLLLVGYFVVGFVGGMVADAIHVFLFVPVLLLDIAALLLGILWVTLRYELVDFLIADQGLTGMDAIRESKRLMQGELRAAVHLEAVLLRLVSAGDRRDSGVPDHRPADLRPPAGQRRGLLRRAGRAVCVRPGLPCPVLPGVYCPFHFQPVAHPLHHRDGGPVLRLDPGHRQHPAPLRRRGRRLGPARPAPAKHHLHLESHPRPNLGHGHRPRPQSRPPGRRRAQAPQIPQGRSLGLTHKQAAGTEHRPSLFERRDEPWTSCK